MKRLGSIVIAAVMTCAPGVEWARFQGTVKSRDLKRQTITLVDQQGDLITVPIDYQVKIIEKKAIKRLQDIELDAKVTLVRTPADAQIEDNSGLVPYKGQQ